jgi:hypothetical protein
MKRSEIRSTFNTPGVILDPEGFIVLKGRLIAEDPSDLFNHINTWVGEYFRDPVNITSVRIELEYINSAGTKSLLNMVRDIGFNCKDRNVNITWCYEKPDEDMLEKGCFISSITGMLFEFQEL